jgi:hypothetical protein
VRDLFRPLPVDGDAVSPAYATSEAETLLKSVGRQTYQRLLQLYPNTGEQGVSQSTVDSTLAIVWSGIDLDKPLSGKVEVVEGAKIVRKPRRSGPNAQADKDAARGKDFLMPLDVVRNRIIVRKADDGSQFIRLALGMRTYVRNGDNDPLWVNVRCTTREVPMKDGDLVATLNGLTGSNKAVWQVMLREAWVREAKAHMPAEMSDEDRRMWRDRLHTALVTLKEVYHGVASKRYEQSTPRLYAYISSIDDPGSRAKDLPENCIWSGANYVLR